MTHLEGAWSPPMQVSSGPSSVSDKQALLLNGQSEATLGWLDGPSIGSSQIVNWANLFPDANSWTTPQTIYANSIPDNYPSAPTLFSDYSGKQSAVFGLHNFTTSEFTISLSRRSNNVATWASPLFQSLTGLPGSGKIVSDTNGNVATLQALGATGTAPWTINLLQIPANSNTWLPQEILGQDESVNSLVAISRLNQTGINVWKQKTTMIPLHLVTERYDFSTQTPTPLNDVPLPGGTIDVPRMFICTAGNGHTILLFDAEFASGRDLYVSTLPVGEDTWTTPILVSNPANVVVSAALACDPSGNAAILWGEENAPQQQFMRAGILKFGQNALTSVTNLTTPAPQTFVGELPQITMDSFGNTAAIWTRSEFVTIGPIVLIQYPVMTATLPFDGAWTPPDTVYPNGSQPQIAINDQGIGVAAWLDRDTQILHASRNPSLIPLSQPGYFVGVVGPPCTLGAGCPNVLNFKWGKNFLLDIAFYRIYRNGVIVDELPGLYTGSKLTVSDLSGTYTIVQHGPNGNASPPLTMTLLN